MLHRPDLGGTSIARLLLRHASVVGVALLLIGSTFAHARGWRSTGERRLSAHGQHRSCGKATVRGVVCLRQVFRSDGAGICRSGRGDDPAYVSARNSRRRRAILTLRRRCSTAGRTAQFPCPSASTQDKTNPRVVVVRIDQAIASGPPEKTWPESDPRPYRRAQSRLAGDYPVPIQFVDAGPLSGTTSAIVQITENRCPTWPPIISYIRARMRIGNTSNPAGGARCRSTFW